MKSIKVNRSTGPDGICCRLLREVIGALIYVSSLGTSNVLEGWRMANVVSFV